MDAAIASMFCNSMFNQQSMGVGGGFFMMVYIKSERKAYAVNARETAPANAFEEMYQGDAKNLLKGL